jgi:uncharacterized protein
MRPWPLLLLSACAGCLQPTPESDGRTTDQVIVSSTLVSRPDGPVRDDAEILPAKDEAKLDTHLRQVLDRTRTALIVVTVSSLGGQDVADYTRSLARQWEVGATRGGVVLLVAPTDRQVRIETDDKVRARLSDEQCAEIIQQVLLPRFRSGDFAGGIIAGVEEIELHL